MSKYRFVHLSDIHFGQSHGGRKIVHRDVRDELMRDCQMQRATLGPASGILVAGDTAFSGKQPEYVEAGEWLDHLTEVVSCQTTDVCVIPGNHDVDHDHIGWLCNLVHNQLRSTSVQSISEELDKFITDIEASNLLLAKLAAYREFAARYGCDFESLLRPVWQKNFSLGQPHTLSIVGLNSVQISDKQDAQGQMILGNQQYIIRPQDEIETIVMVHHPIYWFKDRAEADQYLQRARIVMTGHEHELNILKTINENGLERLQIFAGATTPPEIGGIYQYRYNWLEFELHRRTDRIDLTVTIYPRVWEQSQTRFVPDRNRLNGADHTAISLNCPNFRTTAASPVLSSVSEDSLHDKGGTTESGKPMENIDSEKFARLRYFFWKYLDWQKRLEVLSGLGVLPPGQGRPAPQILERLALDMARKQGKLSALWAAIMDIVPENKREPNPFIQERK